MRRTAICFLAVVLVLPALISSAKDYQDAEEDVPVGMKRVKTGSVAIDVPEGRKTIKTGNVTTMESFREYAIRRFLSDEERIARLEESQKMSSREIERLRQDINDLEKVIAGLKQELQSVQEEADASGKNLRI